MTVYCSDGSRLELILDVNCFACRASGPLDIRTRLLSAASRSGCGVCGALAMPKRRARLNGVRLTTDPCTNSPDPGRATFLRQN